MDCKVKFVDDETLLTNGVQRDWMVCLLPAGATLCIRRGVRTMSEEDAAAVLEVAWQGWRELREAVAAEMTV